MRFHFSRLQQLVVVILCLALFNGGLAQAATVVKMATLVPDGSVWDQILKDMGASWQEDTNGEVSLRVYAGGIAGDEPDVVRKMRIGQIHAAALTVTGLSVIDDGFSVFEIPMLFDSYGELFHVLETLRPDFEKRLADKGYVLLNWGQGGWVHFFSKEPISGVEDLRKQKLFVWAGDDSAVQLWRQNGFQPVPLAATDILTGLQTGMIQALPTTPLAALSLQWFRQTPYMQGLGLAPLVGATVMSERTWKRLSPEAQKVIKESARKAEKELWDQIPKQDERAIQEMSQRGLTVVEVPTDVAAAWRKEAETFIDFQRQRMKAKDLLDRVRQERDAFRAQKASN